MLTGEGEELLWKNEPQIGGLRGPDEARILNEEESEKITKEENKDWNNYKEYNYLRDGESSYEPRRRHESL